MKFTATTKKIVILSIIPLVIFFIALWASQARQPYYLANNQDPAYLYLTNALNLANLKPAGHTDHPGAPLQILGALVITTVHITTDFTKSLVTSVLSNPENYLRAIHLFILLITALALFLLGWSAKKITQNFPAALLIQATPIVFIPNFYKFVTKLSSESLVLPVCLMFIAGLLSISHVQRKNKNTVTDITGFVNFSFFISLFYILWHLSNHNAAFSSIVALTTEIFPFLPVLIFVFFIWGSFKFTNFLARKIKFYLSPNSTHFVLKNRNRSKLLHITLNQDMSLLGITAALGIATKITFLPLLIIPLICLPSKKEKLVFMLVLFYSFILFTLPALPYWKFFIFLTQIASHTGTYGTGASGIIDRISFASNIIGILKNHVAFTASMLCGICSIAVFFLKKSHKSQYKPSIFVLVGILFAQALGIVMVAKHAGGFYIIPTVILSSTVLIISFNLFANTFLSSILAKTILNTAYCSIIVVAIFFTSQSAWHYQKKLAHSAQTFKTTMEKVKTQYPQHQWITTYPASSLRYALYLGNGYAANSYSRDLEKIYSSEMFCTSWGGDIQGFSGWDGTAISFEKIKAQSKEKIIIQGILKESGKAPGFREIEDLPTGDKLYIWKN